MTQKKMTFAETGITDDTPRTPIAPGMTFSIVGCAVRKSAKYDSEYVTIEARNLEGEPIALYSNSGVVVNQCKALLDKYGDGTGALNVEVLCTVEQRSSNNGRTFYTLA